MLTMEILGQFGADTADGLARCLNNEGFYLKMVNMGLKDAHFETLEHALEAGDLNGAFEAAHALKGILGNLALTPLYTPLSEITERLRSRPPGDYLPACRDILALREKLLAQA